VLDPAGAGEDLLVFALINGHDVPVAVENDAPGRGGALVDGGEIAGFHGHSLTDTVPA
jgi:hypothetical protein